MPGFGKPPSVAERVAEQATINKIDETAQHARELHRLLSEALDALAQADPNIKYDPVMLDPNQETIVRYEGKRYRYAIRTTEANLIVSISYAAKTWTETYATPGWQPLDLPAGARLLSGDANRHFVIIRMSNLKG